MTMHGLAQAFAFIANKVHTQVRVRSTRCFLESSGSLERRLALTGPQRPEFTPLGPRKRLSAVLVSEEQVRAVGPLQAGRPP